MLQMTLYANRGGKGENYMRITNRMMTNNMLFSINKNKINLSKLEEQYASGKKIQRPSDDPIVAVRALKLRTDLSAIKQYCDKNIPDAISWMEVTEGSLKNMNKVLKQINTYCVQGSNDTLKASDRSDIVTNLVKMKEQIYDEGNTTYAGRYVFTGYKTNSSMTFTKKVNNLSYDITESLTGESIKVTGKVVGSCNLDTYTVTDPAPKLTDIYRIKLSYDQLNSIGAISYTAGGSSDTVGSVSSGLSMHTVSVNDTDAYIPGDTEINFIPETGELIFGKDAYQTLQNADKIDINYTKDEFEEGDVKPEHYFNCTVTDTSVPSGSPNSTIVYKKADQNIQYEINVSQKLTVNTQASDAISLKLGRDIDTIFDCVNDVIATEEKMEKVKNRLEDTSLTDSEKNKYKSMQSQLEIELKLKEKTMQKAFENGQSSSLDEQEKVNTALADLGSRYNRLQLTEDRLSSQKIDFEDLLSNNEDVNMLDTIINYNSASDLYNASLTAASKILQSSLLNFL
jgi:flagellar hook-associated protein 3 FlgL